MGISAKCQIQSEVEMKACINGIGGNCGGRFENRDAVSLLMGINTGDHNKA